jgi:hypothetical protein
MSLPNREKTALGRFASDAAILSVATVFIYFCAYMFEVGHSFRFGYPPEIIGPTLYSFEGPWVLGILFYLFCFMQLNFIYWPHTGGWLALFVILAVVLTIALLTLTGFFPNWLPAIILFTSGAAFLGRFGFGKFWAKQLNKANESPEEWHPSPQFRSIFTVYDASSQLVPGTIAHALVSKFGFDPLAFAFLLLIVIPCLAAYAGFIQGVGQTNFYAISSPGQSSTELVVRMVGGNIISVPYHPQTSNYDQLYRVRQVSSLGSEVLSPVHIAGPVHLDFSKAYYGTP